MIVKTLIAAAAAFAIAGQAQGADVVHARAGDLSGVTSGSVESFKGVPFAAPPVGPLRWRPPEPAAPWTGVHTADAFGPACIQPQRPGRPGGPMSEDCLTLNVWRPAGVRSGARLPVMVWIYGGAFISGASSFPFYDGTRFAEDGVILVSFNYRLGRLGFFAHPALDRGAGPAGNYGLMDQIAALRWVRDNIAAFGGDPHQVTVFGESAGAISVNYLMGSAPARGLFARAIAESGFGRLEAKTLAAEETVGEAFAKAHAIDGDGASAAEALRALPVEALNATYGGLSSPTLPGPMIDGRIVTETIAQTFANGREAPAAYLEGGNSYEASLFPHVADDPDAAIARAGAPAEVEAIYDHAPAAQIARELLTDSMITEPDRFLARAAARRGRTVFVYHFSYQPAAARQTSFGAAHGFEIPYVFETLPTAPLDLGFMKLAAATPDDEAISRAVHAYWVAFAKTGDPDSAGGPRWPAYTLANDAVMVFGDAGPHVEDGFVKARLDLLERDVKSRDAP